MIVLENVSKEYKNGVHALRNVNLTIEDAEFVYVIGPTGSGKSTLIKLLDGEEIRVTPLEFGILELLIASPGVVFSAAQIYEQVWKETAVSTETVMVHVRNLREKIEPDPRNPQYLKVVWGVGYKLER